MVKEAAAICGHESQKVTFSAFLKVQSTTNDRNLFQVLERGKASKENEG